MMMASICEHSRKEPVQEVQRGQHLPAQSAEEHMQSALGLASATTVAEGEGARSAESRSSKFEPHWLLPRQKCHAATRSFFISLPAVCGLMLGETFTDPLLTEHATPHERRLASQELVYVCASMRAWMPCALTAEQTSAWP